MYDRSFTIIDGKFQERLPLDNIFNQIKNYINTVEEQNKQLIEENKKIKDKKYAENELSSMKKELNEMKSDYYRGFPISEKQDESILIWQDNHLENQHNLKTFREKLSAQGAIGGNFEFRFVPTSIGTIGYCICPFCYQKAQKEIYKLNIKNFKERKNIFDKYDAEFCFQELD